MKGFALQTTIAATVFFAVSLSYAAAKNHTHIINKFSPAGCMSCHQGDTAMSIDDETMDEPLANKEQHKIKKVIRGKKPDYPHAV